MDEIQQAIIVNGTATRFAIVWENDKKDDYPVKLEVWNKKHDHTYEVVSSTWMNMDMVTNLLNALSKVRQERKSLK